MTAKTLEREAGEAAAKLWLGKDPFPVMARSAFVDGYLAAATLRDKELVQLREMADMLLSKLEAVPVEEIRRLHRFESDEESLYCTADSDAIDRWLDTVTGHYRW